MVSSRKRFLGWRRGKRRDEPVTRSPQPRSNGTLTLSNDESQVAVPASDASRRDEVTFLRRIVIENYKNIAACDVSLTPLTFLVGPNGSGKSNFLDALQFVADALRSLDKAIQARGGIADVLSRMEEPPDHFGMRLEFVLPYGAAGHYAFRVGARPGGGFAIQEEECVITSTQEGQLPARFRVRAGEVDTNILAPPVVLTGRMSQGALLLADAYRLPGEFQSLCAALLGMRFYTINPDSFRGLSSFKGGNVLDRDGRNVAAVLARLANQEGSALRRIEEYLSKVTPSVRGVRTRYVRAEAGGAQSSLEFLTRVTGATPFAAAAVSDGTLRTLGILVALFQTADSGESPPLVAIEEPEIYIHPGAAGVLLDALREASSNKQVLVTTHSPDLLDDKDIDASSILAVQSDERGLSQIAPLTQAERSVMRKHLYTAGELLRSNQAQPDPALVLAAHSDGRVALFDE